MSTGITEVSIKGKKFKGIHSFKAKNLGKSTEQIIDDSDVEMEVEKAQI